ncbi:MAG: NADH:flavin oxidoreductase [Bacteroidales bacterium]|nr:NADH:flavin oxidoreductase [Bacteroidales bacterium]MBQ6742562.1 NADH:flavin oxidoreductase [Bacteroidales bacterium]MBQ6742611.1 NADH:flavin oxidoreductase [Bacteroidales bacterium]
MESQIFTPCKIGPIELRNRSIRSAAFENMCKANRPTKELFDYHTAVARGGIGMTTVAYAAVSRSGLSFDGQLWMREEIVPELKNLTDAIHAEGAKASIQLGHCGNMTHRATCGQTPIGASTGFNMYSPTLVRGMKEEEIQQLIIDFGNAVTLAKKAGFDCVEIHAGHGYLISQFISPYTNHRHDKWGGSLENRMRLMQEVIKKVKEAANGEIAVVVKTNMYDGFRSGMQVDDCIKVAQELERLGVDALVLTAGFVSRAPMVVMHGAMPLKAMAHYMDTCKFWWLKAGLAVAGRMMVPTVPYKDLYFLETAKKFRAAVKMPLIYVGGVCSKDNMDTVLNEGFIAFQMARTLVRDTDFMNKIKSGEQKCSECGHSNYCIGRMYTLEMKCHKCVDNLPKKLEKEVNQLEAAVKLSNK